MANCNATKTLEVAGATIKGTCDFDKGHAGPSHYDSKKDVAWLDLDLPDPEVPDVPEAVLWAPSDAAPKRKKK